MLDRGARVYIHARHRPESVPLTEPVFFIDTVPEWGLRVDEVATLFPEFSVISIAPHEGRPPERFLRIVMERRAW